MATNDDSLGVSLNKATNPTSQQEDWEFIMDACDKINREFDGPQVACKMLTHKIQSPQEWEALLSLTMLEACVKHCGKRFHSEIGKFRFLNELIKCVSPKYYGEKTSAKVRKRIIELLYSWTQGLKQETKISEAYQMLKRQNIVESDPIYINKDFAGAGASVAPPPPRARHEIFDDDERSKTLAKLLKSKLPEDLQAANRLIKNMVKEDEAKMEKRSKRVTELETVNNNVQLLTEMLSHGSTDVLSEQDKELMKELYNSCDKLRPNLFRMATETSESNDDDLAEVLKANDNLTKVMALYQQVIEGKCADPEPSNVGLLGLAASPATTSASQDATSNFVDSQLLALGLDDEKINSATGAASKTKSETDVIGKIFGGRASLTDQNAYNPSKKSTTSASLPDYSCLRQSSENTDLLGDLSPPPPPTGLQPLTPGTETRAKSNTSIQQQQEAVAGTAAQKVPPLGVLDTLGQDMLQQSLPPDKKQGQQFPLKNQKVTMGQLQKMSLSSSSAPPAPSLVSPAGGDGIQQSRVTAIDVIAAASNGYASNDVHVTIQSLDHITVPLEKVLPGPVSPVELYSKNSLKLVLHFAKDRPREDVLVLAVIFTSTNNNPVSCISFEASLSCQNMLIRQQDASGTDLPAFNPILPPSALTKVLLIANPTKAEVTLTYSLAYTLNGVEVTEASSTLLPTS